MKIAYISPASFSDVDISLLAALQDSHDIFYYLYLYPSGLRRSAVNIKSPYKKSGVFSSLVYKELDGLTKILHKTSFKVINSTKDSSLSFARIKASWRLFCCLLKGHYDIIHLTMAPGITMLWLYLFRSKLIITIHDPILHSSTTSRILQIERYLAMKLCKKFILLNESQKKEFVDFYHINLKKQSIYDSQLGCYDYLRHLPYKIENEEKYFLFFGMIYSYKGLQFLLPAMEKFHELHPEVKLIVAGGGKFSFDIEKYKSLSYIDIRNRFIPDDELAALIDGSLFVIAPYTDATQSGVVMSAYAFNKPCVVTNVGGLPEMVRHNVTGLVIEPNSVDAICSAMHNLMNIPSQIERFSVNIKSEYEEGARSWKEISKGLNEIYNTFRQ